MKLMLDIQSVAIAIFTFIYLEAQINRLIRGEWSFVIVAYFTVGVIFSVLLLFFDKKISAKRMFKVIIAWLPGVWIYEVNKWMKRNG